MKAKQWLKDNGFIAEVTRGRISLANHEHLAKAVADGVKFDDYAPKVVQNSAGEDRVKNVSVTAQSAEKVIQEITIPYPEDVYEAVETISGVKRSMREACQQHQLSLSGHHCYTLPVITARDGAPHGVAVRIQLKK